MGEDLRMRIAYKLDFLSFLPIFKGNFGLMTIISCLGPHTSSQNRRFYIFDVDSSLEPLNGLLYAHAQSV